MTSKEYIDSLVSKAKVAQSQIEFYTQEQTDALVRAAGKIIVDNAELLSREAVEETRLGQFESKVRKHKLLGVFWNYMKGKPSTGVVDYDPINCVTTLAKPMGVVGAITPSTNPTVSPAFKIMTALKGRNAIVVAPHPRAKKCTKHACDLISAELVKLGAPGDLVQCIEEPTIELSGLLMSSCDVVFATGGFDMVKAAYSSGRPAYGVGQGNVQCIMDEDYTDLDKLTGIVIRNRSADFGSACTGEQLLYIPRSRKDEVLNAFKAKNCYVLDDPKEVDRIRPIIFEGTRINRDVVGKCPHDACKVLGIDIPEDTPVLLIELNKTGADEVLCREIMFPVVRYFIYDDFEDACRRARENLLIEGAGHTSTIYSNSQEHIEYAGKMLPVGRLLLEQPGSAGSGATYANGLAPTFSISCGSWGNNAVAENITYKHLLNYTKISGVIPGYKEPTYEETWDLV